MKKLFNSITSNWKTTLTGLISAALSILVLTSDLIDREQANAIEVFANTIVDNIEAVILAIAGIIAILSRDSDKSSEDSNIK